MIKILSMYLHLIARVLCILIQIIKILENLKNAQEITVEFR